MLNSKDLEECYDYDNNDKSFKKLYECLNLGSTFHKKDSEKLILKEPSAEDFSGSPFKVKCKLDKTDKLLGFNTTTTDRS